MLKSVLAASAILVALCSAAAAHDVVHHPYANSETAVRMPQVRPASMTNAAMAEEADYDAHQYHGGPKVND